MKRIYYICSAVYNDSTDSVDFAIVDTLPGTVEEIRALVLSGAEFAPGEYLLLESNVGIVRKPRREEKPCH